MSYSFYSLGFIGPGGPELLMIMLVLLLVFGAKDAPRVFRKINEFMNQLRSTADSFKREIMYSDIDVDKASSMDPDYGAENSSDFDEDYDHGLDEGYDHDDDYDYNQDEELDYSDETFQNLEQDLEHASLEEESSSVAEPEQTDKLPEGGDDDVQKA